MVPGFWPKLENLNYQHNIVVQYFAYSASIGPKSTPPVQTIHVFAMQGLCAFWHFRCAESHTICWVLVVGHRSVVRISWLKRLSGVDLKYSRSRGKHRFRRSDWAPLLVRAAGLVVLVGICVAGIRWISSAPSSARQGGKSRTLIAPSTSSSIELKREPQVQARNRRIVYPYSVVPGGVASAHELHEVASHDPIVSKHYSGFNYRRAHIIEVRTPRSVYLSYRLGNRIYWTRHQAMLRVGEQLLTDGDTTARARCGNQVSVLPQADTSPEEPTMAELDRPDAAASGMESFPSSLNSSLLHIDPVTPLGPSTAGLGSPGGPGAFLPPPVGSGGGSHGGSSGGGGGGGGSGGGNPPPATPEPSTIVLVLTGAGLVLARYRRQ